MKPTKKENVEGNARQTGNIGTSGVNKNVAWDPIDITKTTIKETNIHDTRTGNIISNEKGAAWDPDDIARTTIKKEIFMIQELGILQVTKRVQHGTQMIQREQQSKKLIFMIQELGISI